MLVIKNITVTFGDKKVLDNFSCDLSDSKIIALFGPSGCGKTTLLRIIAKLCVPDSGEVLTDLTPSFMFQEPRLFPYLTALENVNAVLSDKKETEETAKELLKKCGLYDFDKFPGELSGGMRQRVALARTLAGSGDLLLLDEPFSALDKESKDTLLKLVTEDCRKTVFVTHDEEDLKFADKVIYM